ncbi:MAG: type II secretion system F family protein [Candidatus Pacebacteria bacterium]|nr:type II secretion system F family protein [Candidatus Paceibacterota bacterium]
MLFKYKAKTKTGEIIEGTIEAVDRFSVSRDLRSKGNNPISISAEGGGVLNLDNLIEKIFGKVKLSELIIFTRNLSGMLKAGLPLARALSVVEKQTKNKTFKKILADLQNEINSGGTFSSGLAKYPKVFSKLFISMVRAGEESGNLSNSLLEVGMNLNKSYTLTKKVKGAMIYPGVILGAMVIIGILLFAFVVPTLAKTFVELGVKLPATTRFIIGLGNFFSNYLIFAILSVFAIGFGGYMLFKAKFMQKYIDFVVIRIPVIGTIAKEVNTARTTRTLSSLLLSGVAITRAIEITGDVVQNVYYKKILEEAKDRVEKGSPFSAVFTENTNLYPIMMSEMIQVGEETGKLSDMLLEVASFYEGEIEEKTKNLSTIIEPILMIFIGGGVGFFALSMITPLYSVLNNIG